MSASSELAVLCGLLTCGGVAIAQETEAPDLAFLEYLGSWEESDEDWVLFSLEEANAAKSDDSGKETDPAPQEEKVAELEDED
jgi:hypothetical protein